MTAKKPLPGYTKRELMEMEHDEVRRARVLHRQLRRLLLHENRREYLNVRKRCLELIGGLAPLYEYINVIELPEHIFEGAYQSVSGGVKVVHPLIRSARNEYVEVQLNCDLHAMEMRVHGELKAWDGVKRAPVFDKEEDRRRRQKEEEQPSIVNVNSMSAEEWRAYKREQGWF